MGTSCSTIEAPPQQGGERRQSVLTAPVRLKGDKAFIECYSTTKKVKPTFYAVRHKETQCDYACRVINRSQCPCQDPEVITRHFQTLNGLEHPHICKFVETFEDADNYYMIYEKADSRTLFTHIIEGSSFAEEDAAEYARQLTMALAVAHEQEIIHGRMSPSKVLILPLSHDALMEEDPEEDEELPAQVKICDFGQGLILRETGLRQMERKGEVGDQAPRQELIECMPPEIAWREVSDIPSAKLGTYTYKVDLWSLGCIVFNMLTGSQPHSAASLPDMVERIKTVRVEFGEEWGELTSDARDWVEMALKEYPQLRPTASNLLKHPWLRMPRSRLPKARLLRLLRNVRANASEGHFKRMVMRVIAQQLPVANRELNRIEQCYRFFDRNGDGVLGVPEICKCVRRLELGNDARATDDLEQVVALLDRDGSNTVNLQEFVAGALDPRLAVSTENLWFAFNAFDRDGNGAVSVDEIVAIVRQVEAGLLGKEQVDGLVHEIRQELVKDLPGNTEIDFEQFVFIMNTPTESDGTTGKRFKTKTYRTAFNWCGVDCHDVRKKRPPEWNWQQMSHTAPSAYRRNNLASSRRKSAQMEADQVEAAAAGFEVGKTNSNSTKTVNRDSRRGRQGGQPGQTAKR